MSDLSQTSIGFLGCGKISSAVCRGYASLSGNERPLRLIVSLRNEEKSKALKEEFPDLITVISSSEELVALSDVVFIGLLPKVAREILPQLSFENKLVVSMMAAVDFSEVVSLTRPTHNRVVRTVPLPSAARRTGPILMYPPCDEAEQLLRLVGTPVVCRDEQAMKPLVAVTGHISSFFELMRLTQDWAVDRGVESETARQFVGAFYSSLSQGAEQSHESLAYLCEEAATPGGLNEQAINTLRASEHFTLAEQSLTDILTRLNGGVVTVPTARRSTESVAKGDN